MTDPAWHMRQSIHNYDAHKYLELKNPQYVDWEINTIFYSACKLLDAHLVQNNRAKPSNHHKRGRLVEAEFPAISEEYQNLYELSMVSRYERSVGSDNKAHALKWYRVITDNFAPGASA